MPILKNAKKALRVSTRKTAVNKVTKSKMKTAVDEVRKNASADSLKSAFSSVDRAVKNKLIHRNKAARLKSQFSKLVK